MPTAQPHASALTKGRPGAAKTLMASNSTPKWILFPREHGAWGMLLLPFVAGAILSRGWNTSLGVSLVAVVLAFVVREPLTVLARQRWVWRTHRPESDTAQRALLWQAPLLLLCSVYLWLHLPKTPLAALAAAGAVMTMAAVWMAVHNRSRSIPLQIISAFALSSTGLLAALAGTGRLEIWAWQLWALMSLHSMAGTFNVHARIERKLESKTGRPAPSVLISKAIASALLALAIAAWFSPFRAGAPPLALSAVLSWVELRRLRQPRALQEPFQRVGFRMLGLSIVHLTLVVILLWPQAT